MPKKFRITDPQSHRTFDLDWDSDESPTDDEIDEVLGKQRVSKPNTEKINIPIPGSPYPFNVPNINDRNVSKAATDVFKRFPGIQSKAKNVSTIPNSSAISRMSDSSINPLNADDINLMGNTIDNSIYINPNQKRGELSSTIAHEFAHANGGNEDQAKFVGSKFGDLLKGNLSPEDEARVSQLMNTDRQGQLEIPIEPAKPTSLLDKGIKLAKQFGGRLYDTFSTTPFTELGDSLRELQAVEEGKAKFDTNRELRLKTPRELVNDVIPGGNPLELATVIPSTIQDVKEGNYGGALANIGLTAAAGYGLSRALRGAKIKPKIEVLPKESLPTPKALPAIGKTHSPARFVSHPSGKLADSLNPNSAEALRSLDLEQPGTSLSDVEIRPNQYTNIEAKQTPTWDFNSGLGATRPPDLYNPIRSHGIGDRDYLTEKGNILSTVPNRLRPEAPNVTGLRTLAGDVGDAPVITPKVEPKTVNIKGGRSKKVKYPSLDINEPDLPSAPPKGPISRLKEKPAPKDTTTVTAQSIIDKKLKQNPELRTPTFMNAIRAIPERIRQSDWYRTLYKPAFVSDLTKLERLGDAGKELAQTLKDLDTAAERHGGESSFSTRNARRKLNKTEHAELIKLLDGQKSISDVTNQKVIDAYKASRASLDELADEAIGTKMTMKTSDGRTVPFQKHQGEYFPRRYSPELFENPDTLRNALLKAGKSTVEANAIVKNVFEKGERFHPSQHTRDLDLPGYREDLDVLEDYQRTMARRVETAKRLGPGDLSDPDSPVQQLIKRTTNPEEASKIVETYLNRNERISSSTYKKIVKAEVAMHMSRFAITNLGDTASIVAQFGPTKVLKGIAQILRDPHGAGDLAHAAGARTTLMSHVAGEIEKGTLLSKVYDMGTDKFLRTLEAVVGKSAAEDYFAKAKAGNKVAKANLARFVEGNVDEILKQDKLTDRQLGFASRRATEVTSGTPNSLNTSQVLKANNPILRLPSLFKRFAFISTKNMVDTIKAQPTPAARAAKIAAYATAYQASGEAIGDIKAAIDSLVSGNSSKVLRRGEYIGSGNKVFDRIMANYLQSNLIGLLGTYGEDIYRSGQNKITGAAFGPVGSDLDELFQDLSGPNKLQKLGKSAARRVPFIGPGLAATLGDKPKKSSLFKP